MLLFIYGKELTALATVHHGLNVRDLDSNKGLQKCIHGFAYIVPLTFLNFTAKFNDTLKKDAVLVASDQVLFSEFRIVQVVAYSTVIFL